MKKFIILLFLIFICFSASKIFALDKVEINTASLAQLDEITEIGPVLAQKIVDARPFSSVDDLLRISGIGEKTLQKIKEQGLAYVEEQNQQPAQETNLAPTPVPLPTPTPTPSPTPAPAITYPSGIVFNEILPSPEGADETEEWVELYNDNSFEVGLSGWKIQDSIGAVNTFISPNGTKIGAGGFLVFKRPQTKITMNNSGDKLVLFRPDGNVADSVGFEKALLNFSYNRLGFEWKWSGKLTPGGKNIIESNPSLVGTEAQKQPDNDNIDDKIVADLKKGVENAKSFSFLFFGAILLAIILVIIFFLLKTRFRK